MEDIFSGKNIAIIFGKVSPKRRIIPVITKVVIISFLIGKMFSRVDEMRIFTIVFPIKIAVSKRDGLLSKFLMSFFVFLCFIFFSLSSSRE